MKALMHDSLINKKNQLKCNHCLKSSFKVFDNKRDSGVSPHFLIHQLYFELIFRSADRTTEAQKDRQMQKLK